MAIDTYPGFGITWLPGSPIYHLRSAQQLCQLKGFDSFDAINEQDSADSYRQPQFFHERTN